jgi:prevent-host-death family protein
MNHHSRVWSLQEAKAKLSEVVKRAMTEGPQRVTLHGKAAVKIVIDDEASQLGDAATGAGLVEILNKSPLREFEHNTFKRAKVKVTSRRIDL